MKIILIFDVLLSSYLKKYIFSIEITVIIRKNNQENIQIQYFLFCQQQCAITPAFRFNLTFFENVSISQFN